MRFVLLAVLLLSLSGCESFHRFLEHVDVPDDPPVSDAGIPPRPGPGPEVADPVIPDCEVATSAWETNGESPLWVASIYETRGNRRPGADPTGQARATFDLPGIHKLALVAYEPTNWNLWVGDQSLLEEIILVGHHRQTVNVHNGSDRVRMVRTFTDSVDHDDHDSLARFLESRAGARPTRIDSCDEASGFRWQPKSERGGR